MSTVLVTGGGGFIGKEVVRELTARKCAVRVFDLVKSDRTAHEYTGSVLDPYELSQAVKGCDYVIHLAAALGVQNTEINRLECLYINIQGTVNVLEACVKARVKKIVFASSSEVYGEQARQPISEDAPLNPKSNYAASKIVGEEYLKAYKEAYGLEYNIVRFFNVYGEWQKENFVIPRFVKNVVQGLPPVIYGKGDQTRCFCYVQDAARGIVAALFSPVKGEVFNIGNDREAASVKELARKVIAIAGSPLKPKFVSYDDADRESDRDIIKRVLSIEKAKKVLRYRPSVTLDEGLGKMIDFYRTHHIHREAE